MSGEKKSHKIIFSLPNLGLGGAQVQTVQIANALCGKGFRCVIFSLSGGELKSEIKDEIKITVRRPPKFLKKFRTARLICGLLSLARTVVKEKPDIIYSRHWTKIPCAIIGKILGIKTVWTEGNSAQFLKKENPPLFWAHKFFIRHADCVTANSKGLAEEIKNIYGLKFRPRLIHNGIDTDGITKKSRAPAKHRWLGGKIPLIISVGRIAPQKGFATLIKAVKEANKKTPVRLIIIGSGSEKRSLVKETENSEIAACADFIGSETNPHKYTARCDIFVCPSEQEGFSNSLLEAAALGMPIVSTDHPFGANEIIENGKSGLLVPVGNAKKMSDAIVKLLEDRALAKAMGETAKLRADSFSIEKIAEEHVKLFVETAKG